MMNKLTKWLTLSFLVSMVGLFVYVSADLPDRADPHAPASEHLAGEFIVLTEEELEIPNVVSAILADFRGYDTLGETFVIFTAGLAVLLVLQRGYRRND
jgi:multicomponent Na+:H+ antiporter subunit B